MRKCAKIIDICNAHRYYINVKRVNSLMYPLNKDSFIFLVVKRINDVLINKK